MHLNVTYQWHGVNQSGEKVTGIIEAGNVLQAKSELRRHGVITRRIVKKRQFILNQSIKQTDITLFTRQLATLIKAGIPLIRSFDILQNGTGNQKLKTLIRTIRQDIQSGFMLAQALRKHPLFFNALFCNMVDAGELSGSLDTMLDKMATHKEKTAAIKKKVVKALTYPTAVMFVAIIITCGLLIFVIPQFESLFNSFGAELPALTLFVMQVSKFFIAQWGTLTSIISVIIYGYIYGHKHYPKVTHINHQMSLRLPIIGQILQKASIARLTRTLSITLAAGLPLTEALKSVAGVTGNNLYAQAASSIREEISSGQSLQHAIKNTGLFPCLVTQMVAVGEESGTLEQMLLKIADFYEEDVSKTVDALSSLLEPVIMTILGLLVGSLVVAMYLPILKLGTVI